jgi:hypothetical protein
MGKAGFDNGGVQLDLLALVIPIAGALIYTFANGSMCFACGAAWFVDVKVQVCSTPEFRGNPQRMLHFYL